MKILLHVILLLTLSFAHVKGAGSVNSLAQLANYSGRERTIDVRANATGGRFEYTSDALPADGALVVSAKGKRTGSWVRQFEYREGLNVQWFGTFHDGKRDDSKALQNAIDKAARRNINKISIPKGHYLISRSLIIPSNFTLVADTNAYIELKKSSNQYLLRNKDLENGNKNIRISGGTWNGNGWSQKRTIRETVANSEFVFGFFFYKVKNLEVARVQIDSTRSWGIAYMECDSVHIHDIRFQQNPFKDDLFTSALLQNGDGVTGGGDNVLIENISGFTNDDLIAFASGGASFQGKMSPFPAKNYRNVTVRNIFPENIYDSIPPLKAVAFYTFENTRVSDIFIENVKGNTAMASVLFYSLFNKKGVFSNVKVRNIEGTNVYSRSTHPGLYHQYGIVTVRESEIDNLTIEHVTRTENAFPTPQFRFDDLTHIKNLTISDVRIVHRNVTGNLLWDPAKARLDQVSITGVSIIPGAH